MGASLWILANPSPTYRFVSHWMFAVRPQSLSRASWVLVGLASWEKELKFGGKRSGKNVPRNPLHSLLENLLDIWPVLTVFIGLIFGTKSKDRRTTTGLGNSYWGSADSAFGTNLKSSLSRVPQLRPLPPACSQGVQWNKKREIVIVRHVLPAIGARTSYLNQRSSGIWGWAVWAFCWVCFSLSQFPARRAFPCTGFSSRSSVVDRRSFAELGSCCTWPLPRGGCFSQLKPESQHHRCHASICSSVLCLITTKIWSDGH